MNTSSIVFAVVISCAIFFKQVHGDGTEAPLTDHQKMLLICYLSCNHGNVCPPSCPQTHISSPWGKRSAMFPQWYRLGRYPGKRSVLYPLRSAKRAFDHSSEFQGLSFDDYGWFMKLLGRVDKKK